MVSANTARTRTDLFAVGRLVCSLVRFDNQDAGNQLSAQSARELIFVLPSADAPARNILSSTSATETRDNASKLISYDYRNLFSI